MDSAHTQKIIADNRDLRKVRGQKPGFSEKPGFSALDTQAQAQ